MLQGCRACAHLAACVLAEMADLKSLAEIAAAQLCVCMCVCVCVCVCVCGVGASVHVCACVCMCERLACV